MEAGRTYDGVLRTLYGTVRTLLDLQGLRGQTIGGILHQNSTGYNFLSKHYYFYFF